MQGFMLNRFRHTYTGSIYRYETTWSADHGSFFLSHTSAYTCRTKAYYRREIWLQRGIIYDLLKWKAVKKRYPGSIYIIMLQGCELEQLLYGLSYMYIHINGKWPVPHFCVQIVTYNLYKLFNKIKFYLYFQSWK